MLGESIDIGNIVIFIFSSQFSSTVDSSLSFLSGFFPYIGFGVFFSSLCWYRMLFVVRTYIHVDYMFVKSYCSNVGMICIRCMFLYLIKLIL